MLPVILAAGCAKTADNTDYTQFVNPKIGSGGHGHVFVGANVLFGMVQMGEYIRISSSRRSHADLRTK